MKTRLLPTAGLFLPFVATLVAIAQAQIASPNLTLWLRADMGVTKDANGWVSAWEDQSPRSNHLAQADANRRPFWTNNVLNGLPVLQFQDDWISRAAVPGANLFANTAATVFLVQKQLGSDHRTTTISWRTGSDHRWMIHATYDDQIGFQLGQPNSGGSVVTAQPPGWDDTWHVLAFRRDGTNGEVRVDGIGLLDPRTSYFRANGDSAQTADLHLGSDIWGNTFNGDIAEAIAYNTALSDADLRSVEALLRARWGLPTAPAAIPDLLIKTAAESDAAYAADNVYQLTPAGSQVETQTVAPLQTAIFHVKAENDNSQTKPITLKAAESATSGWAVAYKLGASNITAQIVSAGGFTTTNLPPRSNVVVTVEIAMTGVALPGTSKTVTVTAHDDWVPNLVRDAVQAVAVAGPGVQPDLMVRRDIDPNPVGDNVYNLDGAGQTRWHDLWTNQTVTYRLTLANDGNVPAPMALTGTAGGGGWTVNYFDYALRFDGADDYVELGAWAPGVRWTVEAWVKILAAPDTRRRTIAGGAAGGIDWGITLQNGRLGVLTKPVDGGSTITYGVGTPAETNLWYHVVGTCDGTNAWLYVDGAARTNGPVYLNYSGYSGSARIGGEACCGGNNFPGLIRDVRIWNRALDAQEVQAAFTGAFTGAEPGLVGYWPLNEGTGTITRDLSSALRFGTLVNGPSWQRNDLTTPITGGGYRTPALMGGDRKPLLVEVTPDGSVPGGTSNEVLLTATAVGDPSKSDAVRMITTAIRPSATPVNALYTTTADFGRGWMSGLDPWTVPDQLQLSRVGGVLPFLWVPNSGDGTVSKVDTRTGDEVGRYRVCPPGVNGNPSRTTVDLRGSCWVANRNCSTAVKIGLLEHGEFADRNGDGVVQTSRDLNGDGSITGSELLDWGQDECVLHEVFLTPGHETNYVPARYLGSYLNNYWNPGLRGMAVDARGNLWAGTHDTMKYFYIDGVTGQILRAIDVAPSNHTAYGAVIDAQGILWSSGYKESGQQNLLRLDPADGSYKTFVLDFRSYGLALDRNNHLFVSAHQEALLTRWNTLTGTREWTVNVGGSNRGVALTDDGDVWVVSSSQGTVTRFSNEGVKKASIAVGPTPTGVAVDAAGQIWVMGTGDEYLRRINPTKDTVDFVKRIASSHYGYSDMTGAIVRNSTVRLGLWSAVHDAQIPDTAWTQVLWHGSDPTGTNILVRVRSSNDHAVWSAWEHPVNGAPLRATPPGRYLEFEVTLRSLLGVPEPVLFDIAATGLAPGEADLGLLLSASPNPVLNQHRADYLVTVTNSSTNWAATVWVTNAFPSSLDVLAVSVPGGSYQRSGQEVVCRLNGVGPQSSATIAILLEPQVVGTFTNTAVLRASGPDPNPANNTNRLVLEAIPPPCVLPPAGLVAWWPGESNAWSRVGSHHGTAQGASLFAAAKVGLGFTFDANEDRVSVPHAPELNPSRSGFSAQFWMKGAKQQPGQADGLCTLLEKSHGWVDYTGWAFQTYPASGVVNFNIGNDLDGNWPNVSSLVDVLDDRWHHVASTWDGFTIRLYVDGELQGIYPLLRPGLNTRALNIGFAWGNGSPRRFFRGQLDEVMIFNRTLLPAEVVACYEAGPAGGCLHPPSILQPAVFPDGVVGLPLALQVVAGPGTPPWVRFELVSGALPLGLNLDLATGLVSGRPTTAGAYAFTIRATDAAGQTGQRAYANTVYACVSPPSGLVGWWRAENNADDYASTNHGTLEYQAGYDLGQVGRAFLLDGNDDAIRLFGTSGSALRITTNQVTVDAWVNLNATNPPATGHAMIFDKAWDGSANGYELAVYQGELRFWLGTTDTSKGFAVSFPMPLQRWAHVAATYDGIMARLYLDGAEVASGPLTGNILGNNHDACIGNDNWPNSRNYAFNGLIDEVHVFNRGLSASEIAAIYQAGLAGLCVPAPADLLVKTSGEPDSAFALDNTYEAVPSPAQTKSQAVYPLQTAVYRVKIENDGPDARSFVLRAAENPPTNWVTVYKLGAVDVTAALHSSTGLATTVLAPGASQVITVEATPDLRVGGGAWQSAVVAVYADTRSVTVRDSVQALTQCLPTYQPDVAIRRENDVNFLGLGVLNPTGAGQTKPIEIEAGNTALYRVQLRNSGNVTNRFTLTGSAGGGGWNVEYCGGWPSLSFNGLNQYVAIGNAPAFQLTNVTIEGWFNFSAVSGSRLLVSKTFGTGADNSYVMWVDGNGLRGYVRGIFVTYSWHPTPGTWYHFAFTFDDAANTQALYVDGQLRASVATSASVTWDAHPLMFGMEIENENLMAPFAGQMSEIRLWNAARTPAQIAANMNRRLSGTEPGLAGLWHLDEGDGLIARDSTPNANHGVLFNEPVWSLPVLPPPVCQDITSEITGAGWTNVVLAPGATYEFTVAVTPNGGVPGGSIKDVLVTALSLSGASPPDAVRAVTTVSRTSGVPEGGRYTSSEDFANNHQEVGVDHATVPDQLQLASAAVTLPFLWVPNNEGTISKVDTRLGQEVARYRTCPTGVNGQPSRTTVDLQGSCWVVNRYAGTVVKIGLLDNGVFLDRNGNGLADTSRDLNNDGDISGAELLPWGQDECVLFEVMLSPGTEGTYTPGSYTGGYYNSWGDPGPRGVAVDPQGHCWVGTLDSKKLYYISGANGQILRIVGVAPLNHRTYGAVLDPNGILWASSHDRGWVLRFDPATGALATVPLGHFSYGINADRQGHIFVSGWQDTRLSRVNALTAAKEWTVTGIHESRGIAITDDGDVWVANSAPGTVARWSNDGVLKAIVPAGSQPTGVAVDHAGKVWVLGLGDEFIRRIDPARDQVDLTKRIVCANSGGYHYGYSDMTGNVARNTTTRIGTWIVRHNAKVLNTPWGMVGWESDEPPGTSLRVRVRSSNNQQTWSVWETVASGVPLHATPPGKYLEVEVTLQSAVAGATPVLYDLAVHPAQEANYGSLVYANDFEDVIGSAWSVDRAETSPVGARRFLGAFGNQTVTLTLSNLPPHAAATLVFDQFVLGSWDGNSTNDGPDRWEVNVGGGLQLVNSTFNNGPANSVAAGQAFPGAFPGAMNPALSGASETNTLGFMVVGVGVMDSVYRHVYSFPHITDSLVLNFLGSGLAPDLGIESWGLDNVRVYLTPIERPPFLVPLGFGDTGFVVKAEVAPDWNYILQASTNLVTWEGVSTNRAAATQLLLPDPRALQVPVRFYRLLQTP
ncbi:MAG: hypothetical protein FJ387_13210 [Verrucomicrobia bacterium]|nr:hypothetical protein [Verrucomicrobiota bacterium]